MRDASGLTLQFSRHPLGLRAHATGRNSLPNAIACWQAIVSELQDRPERALLLVDELHGAPLLADDWRAVLTAMAGRGLEQVRIAHVRPAGRQPVEHCEVFARDAGIEARVFHDEAAGERWLRYGNV